MAGLKSAWANLPTKKALKVALIYALISSLWILFSDQAVDVLVKDPVLRSSLSTYKGWAFVVVTAILMYKLIERNLATLLASEERYRRLAENFPNGTVNTYDRNFRITFVAGQDLQYYAVPADMFIGKQLAEIAPPETCAIAEPNFRAAFEGRTRTYEAPYPDGRSYEVSVTPLRDSRGEISEILVVSHNITKRKQAEAELRATRDFLTSLLENAPVSIYATSTDSRLQVVNRAWEESRRLTREQALGATLDELFPADLAQRFAADNQRVVQTAAPINLEETVDDPDGRHYFQTVKFPLRDAAGRVTSVGGISIDITPRVTAEKQVLRLNRLYELISQVNQTIVRVRNRQLLFEEICRVAIEYGEFRLAWIGLVMSDGAVRPTAHRGPAGDYVDHIRIEVTGEHPNRGPVGVAVREGRCVVSNDLHADATMQSSLEAATRFNLQSLAAVPIRLGQTVIGALVVYADEQGFFDAAETVLLEEIGGDIAFALDAIAQEQQRIQAEHAVVQRNRELTALLDVGRRLTRQLEVHAVLQILVQAVHQTVPMADGASVWLYEVDLNQLMLKASAGHADDLVRGLAVTPSISLVGRVFQSGQPYVSNDTRRDPAFEPLGRAERTAVQSAVGVPLIILDRTLGVLFADNFTRPNAFEHNDVRLLQTLAAMAASALHNAQLYEQISRAAEHLRRLTQQVVTAQETERRRLSRELHDETGQSLTALKLNLQLMQLDLPADSPALRAGLTEAVALADATMQHIRSLAHDLRPPALDTLGLAAALAGLCRDTARRASLDIRLDMPGLPAALPDAIAVTLYRCLQEALTNVVKHAAASTVNVECSATADRLQLIVEDDGRGFDAAAGSADHKLGGIGLIGMTERLELLGGRLDIGRRSGRGTRLVITIPLERPL